MSRAASGQQFVLSAGDQHVTIVEVGGGIHEYRVGDRDVLQPYPVEQLCDGAHGAPLIPWPNRLGDGRYSFDGTDYQVALTNRTSATRSTVSCTGGPATGPAPTAAVSIRICPQATAWSTTAPCSCRPKRASAPTLNANCELPTGTESVDGTSFDFRTPRQLGQLRIDNAFTDLERDQAGRAWVRLGRPDGHTAELWVDETLPIIELYTADTLSPDRRRRGLGTEPMSCPPNAFQTGRHGDRPELFSKPDSRAVPPRADHRVHLCRSHVPDRRSGFMAARRQEVHGRGGHRSP
jgi:aldose 1-epimerase